MIPVSASDLSFHRVISAIDAVPDSDNVVFLVSRMNVEGDSYRSSLWGCENGRPYRIVDSQVKPSSPKLSPRGTEVAYLSKAGDGGTQMRVGRIDGESDRPVGEPSKTLSGILAWSPDGTRVIVTHRVGWKEDEFDDPSGGESRPRVTRHLPYKQDGGGIRAGFRTECRVIDVTTGTQSILLRGDFDVTQAAWSADGEALAYIRNRTASQRHFTDVWLANADGSDARQVTEQLASVNAVSWSPDGKRLAVVGSEIEGDSMADLHVLDVASGALRRPASEDLQLETGTPVWHPDGSRIAVLVARNGLQGIAVVDVTHGDVLHPSRGLTHIKSFAVTANGFVFTSASMRTLNEVFRCDWDGSAERRLTRFNRQWFATRARPRVVRRRFDVPDGNGGTDQVDAWLLMPAQGNGPFPVMVDMHGGPQSTVLIDFASHAYWYALVSLGWMVVAPNCVGSGSYGADFARRLRGRWGELDLPQHLAIVTKLQQEGIASDHVACAGKSYGGFLSAYALGHTDVFKSVVISAPVANIESHCGTSDSGYYVSPYAMGVELTDDREPYRTLSPIDACASRTASVMLLQGADDQRCPLGQAEEVLAHLIRSGIEATMVVYPGGSHSMAGDGKPSHRVDYHHRIAHWLHHRAGESSATAD